MKRLYMFFGMTFLFSIFMLTVNAWGAPYISFYSTRTGQTDVYIIDTNGKNLRNLTNHPAGDYCTTWAPDGRSFAFMSERDGNPEIYIKKFNEAQALRLTNHPELDYGPTWSPDGNWIAFVSKRTGESNIYKIDINGKNLQRLTNQGNNSSPAWSPDGQSIAFSSLGHGRFGIFVMDADGKHPRQIIKLLPGGGLPYSPAWSPDGKQIACTVSFPIFAANFAANVVIDDQDDHDHPDGSGIYIMDTDGQNARRISPLGTLSYNPAWSPDGKWIAYDAYDAEIANPLENLHVGKHIFIVSVEGGEPRQITQHPEQNACPAWVLGSSFSISPTVDTQTTLWGWLKQAEHITQ